MAEKRRFDARARDGRASRWTGERPSSGEDTVRENPLRFADLGVVHKLVSKLQSWRYKEMNR
jgi:hypothetical protein